MEPSWLKYANQGATRRLPLNPQLVSALGFLPKPGLNAEVFSGGQPGINQGGPRTGSVRHDHGRAADVFFYKDGRRLDWSNPQDTPIFQDIVRQGRAAGLTGFGAGRLERGAGIMGRFGEQSLPISDSSARWSGGKPCPGDAGSVRNCLCRASV